MGYAGQRLASHMGGLSWPVTYVTLVALYVAIHYMFVSQSSQVLAIMGVFIGGALTLFAIRAPLLAQGGLFAPISREGSLVLNNLLLTTACAAVFVGTLYPLALESISQDKISVGPPFFNYTFVPLIVPLLLVVPFGPLLAWKRGDALAAAQRLTAAAALALIVAVALFMQQLSLECDAFGTGGAARALMGNDFWSYGVAPNRHVIEAFLKAHHAQGLSPRLLRAEVRKVELVGKAVALFRRAGCSGCQTGQNALRPAAHCRPA